MTRARLARLLGAAALVALALAIATTGKAAWIQGKALLAQYLLRDAWDQARADGAVQRPWPWADTWPVGRLVVPSHDIDAVVLAGATPQSLAFGPAHWSTSARPGGRGNTLLLGHRDTHFAFLRDLEIGEIVLVEGTDGARRSYRVEERHIVHESDTWLASPSRVARLTLLTCYPFDPPPGPIGPLRFAVVATEIAIAAPEVLGF
jgi:sortase A